VSRGASAVIDGNIIENTGRNGITLGGFATANIVNNTIQNNASAGILVTGNAFGFIGFATADDPSRVPTSSGTTGLMASA
jgi:parallel beta-helix repeat protein